MSLSPASRPESPGDGVFSDSRAASLDGGGTTSHIVEMLRAAGCVFAEEEAALLLAAAAADDSTDLAGLVARRAAGIPLEHVVGWAEFRGHRITLEEGVFVPRRRTEFLVGLATELVVRAVEE